MNAKKTLRTLKTMNNKLQKAYTWILTAGGLAGAVAMTWQASERIAMLKNPTKILSCNLNPIVDCGTVLNHRLSALFGFPNAFIGMIVFAMLTISGVLLLTGNKPNQKFKNVIFGLSVVLLLFSMWFFGTSLYVIGKVCIFCFVGWVVSVPIFLYGLLYWLEDKPKKSGWLSKLQTFLVKNHVNILAVWYLLMLVLYLINFRSYYFG